MASRAIVRRSIISDCLSVYARSWSSQSVGISAQRVDSHAYHTAIKRRESFRRDGSSAIVRYMSVSTEETEDLLSRLSTAGSLSDLKKVRETHGYLLRKGFPLEGSIAVALVDMYGCCGDLRSAQTVFDGMEKKGTEDFASGFSIFARMTSVQRVMDLIQRSQNEEEEARH
ncbi:unnamed protein product [Microthlaspi erraticum]|uniref:Pentacotripeptide-repeat region of PRORP domain-containing protein n=1 Tax=Microthlaspi erraticum TaxID=1685480 RepID=A0A6D2J498_9BRAS|nr:unnamed protein product [Microthlaspi erraticum]